MTDTQKEASWVLQQKKAFTAWVNSKLEKKGMSIEEGYVDTAFRDGIVLIHFLEALTGKHVGKIDITPKSRHRIIANLTTAMNFLEREELHMTSVSAEDFADCNEKAVLGFVWSMFSTYDRHRVEEAESGSDSKDPLLVWCRQVTIPYENVDIRNYSKSFQDGLAFCALVHSERPDLFDFETAATQSPAERLELAFRCAQDAFGIPRLLDPADFVTFTPDPKSVEMYVCMLHNAFHKESQLLGLRSVVDKLDATKKTMQEEMEELRAALKTATEEQAKMNAALRETTAALETERNARREAEDAARTAHSEIETLRGEAEGLRDETAALHRRCEEEERAALLLSSTRGEAEQAGARMIEENRALREDVEHLTAAQDCLQRMVDLSKAELSEAIHAGAENERALRMARADFFALLTKLQTVYDSFGDPLALARVVFGEKRLNAAALEPDKEGMLSLRVGKSGPWQKWQDRYVVLKDNFIFLFKTRDARVPARVVRLDTSQFERTERGERKFCLKVRTNDNYKNVLFSAESADEQDEWFDEFEHASRWWTRTDEVVSAARLQNARMPLALTCAMLVQFGLPRGMFMGPNGIIDVSTPEGAQSPLAAALRPLGAPTAAGLESTPSKLNASAAAVWSPLRPAAARLGGATPDGKGSMSLSASQAELAAVPPSPSYESLAGMRTLAAKAAHVERRRSTTLRQRDLRQASMSPAPQSPVPTRHEA